MIIGGSALNIKAVSLTYGEFHPGREPGLVTTAPRDHRSDLCAGDFGRTLKDGYCEPFNRFNFLRDPSRLTSNNRAACVLLPPAACKAFWISSFSVSAKVEGDAAVVECGPDAWDRAEVGPGIGSEAAAGESGGLLPSRRAMCDEAKAADWTGVRAESENNAGAGFRRAAIQIDRSCSTGPCRTKRRAVKAQYFSKA